MWQKVDDITGPAPNIEMGTPQGPAFALFIVGFLEVLITVGRGVTTYFWVGGMNHWQCGTLPPKYP